ncbi:MAG: hypothetical protein LQ347_003765 [Umbilicaria vellea]|nr:MAG: hypothetical protein LQ347_003765 [Umbilicaria vellea]
MVTSTKTGLKDNPAMSFVMLTDSHIAPHQTLVNGSNDSQRKRKPGRDVAGGYATTNELSKQSVLHHVDSPVRLFEILSSRSDIDHPVCTECSELLLTSLQARLASSTKERDAYIAFLRKMNNNIPTDEEVAKARAELAKAKTAESEAFSELRQLEKERASLDDELADLEAESRALDLEEESFWRSRNTFALKLSSFQNERDALNASYDHDAQQLERLQRTNVYNDTFCIGHDGYFGTINGLRLGRLPPPQNVEWAEINAAWGMTSLLLATVAEKLAFTFRGYKIKPMGSTSKIDKIEYPSSSASTSTSNAPPNSESPQPPKISSLELYSSGDLPLGRMFIHRRFDAAMVAFLDCLRQLGEFVEKGHTTNTDFHGASHQQGGLKLPYEIRKDKIGDASIKLGASQDEAWTRACKYALTCCKFLLAHASNVGGAGSGRRTAS